MSDDQKPMMTMLLSMLDGLLSLQNAMDSVQGTIKSMQGDIKSMQGETTRLRVDMLGRFDRVEARLSDIRDDITVSMA